MLNQLLEVAGVLLMSTLFALLKRIAGPCSVLVYARQYVPTPFGVIKESERRKRRQLATFREDFIDLIERLACVQQSLSDRFDHRCFKCRTAESGDNASQHGSREIGGVHQRKSVFDVGLD